MTDRDERNGRRAGTPERVAVYDRPDRPVGPTSTTGTTGVARPAGRYRVSAGRMSVGWLIPAAVVLLLAVALLFWIS
ncbi:MAG TPA: hypothetical protein VK943_06700 [Arenibaculum sp.]|nr:hypothetical protein [Arenibaculum sp.]